MRSDDFEYEDQQAAPSKLIKKMGKQPELYNPNDEDFIANVRKPMRPKTKQEYLQQIKAKPSQEAKRRPQPRTTAARPDNARHLAPAKQPSLDKDFIMQGQMGETFFKQINETIHDGDLGQKQPRNQHLSNADLATAGKLEEINVELASRPFSGGQRRRRANQKRRILRADQRNMLVKDESEEAATRRRQREQQILEGIERFQDMLKRNPMQPKQQRSSNTLANKNLQRVYGKIQQQYARNV